MNVNKTQYLSGRFLALMSTIAKEPQYSSDTISEQMPLISMLVTAYINLRIKVFPFLTNQRYAMLPFIRM